MVNNHRKPSNPMVAPKYVATTLFDRQWTTQWISDPKNVRKQSKAMVPQQKNNIHLSFKNFTIASVYLEEEQLRYSENWYCRYQSGNSFDLQNLT